MRLYNLVSILLVALFVFTGANAQELEVRLSIASGQTITASELLPESICLLDDYAGLTVETSVPILAPIINITITDTSTNNYGSFTALPCNGSSFSYAIVQVIFTDGGPTPTPNPSPTPTPVPTPTPTPLPIVGCATEDVCVHGFINSLWDHRNGSTPDASNNPNWLHALYAADGVTFKSSGEFGFLANFADLPPNNQLGYSLAPNPWVEGQPFSSVGFDHIFIAPANFIQFVDSTEVRHTEIAALLDYARVNAPGAKVWLYQGLADNGGYEQRLQDYYDYNRDGYTDWFIDHLRTAQSSGYDLGIIPLASVFSNLMEYTALGDAPFNILFEDNAPHGGATVHLVYSMIVYTYVTGRKAPTIAPLYPIDSALADNYEEIANFIFDTRVIF